MTTRARTRFFLRILPAALLFDGGVASACLHGAFGSVQTSVVAGNDRVDRIRVEPDAGNPKIMKVFVGPRALIVDTTIQGITLTDSEEALHADLAVAAEDIRHEQSGDRHHPGSGLRGGPVELPFRGSGVVGGLTELTLEEYPNWADVRTKLKLGPRMTAQNISRITAENMQYSRWLQMVRSAGRSAYALQVDTPNTSPVLAIRITYPGEVNASEIVSDKMLETVTARGITSITWFQGLSNAALNRAAAQVATADEGGSDFSYNLSGVGRASLRSRTADTRSGPARNGILWME